MYYAHFGLSEAPFRITPNTEVFFAGGNRGAILDALKSRKPEAAEAAMREHILAFSYNVTRQV